MLLQHDSDSGSGGDSGSDSGGDFQEGASSAGDGKGGRRRRLVDSVTKHGATALHLAAQRQDGGD